MPLRLRLLLSAISLVMLAFGWSVHQRLWDRYYQQREYREALVSAASARRAAAAAKLPTPWDAAPRSAYDRAKRQAILDEFAAADAARIAAMAIPSPTRPPFWLFPVILFVSMLPTQIVGWRYWVLNRRRRRRREMNQCVYCGYDVRETPGRCPECGNRPREKTTSERAEEGW